MSKIHRQKHTFDYYRKKSYKVMVREMFLPSVPPYPLNQVQEVLMVRHDVTQHDYFPQNPPSLNLNENSASPETERLFSRMQDIIDNPESFKRHDGLFHFKLCYPGEIGQTMFY